MPPFSATVVPVEAVFGSRQVQRHGAMAGNLSRPLADLLDCTRFAISPDGSRRHHHPDPEAIARLLLWKPGPKEFYFNYRHEEAAIWDNNVLKQDYDYRCIFPQDGNMGGSRSRLPEIG